MIRRFLERESFTGPGLTVLGPIVGRTFALVALMLLVGTMLASPLLGPRTL